MMESRVVKGFCSRNGNAPTASFRCPSDKSLTHRAIIFSCMAKGKSQITQPLMGADCISTFEAFRLLGVEIVVTDSKDSSGVEATIQITSKGTDSYETPNEPLDFGNSGTTARLMIGLLAAIPGLKVKIIGDPSLSQRPMHRVVLPLRNIGACISGREDGNYFPIEIEGQNLRPAHHPIDKASAQIKSCILLAGTQIQGKTEVTLPVGGRDHSEKLLQTLGANCKIEFEDRSERITIEGKFNPPSKSYKVPGDPSSAAFFAVLAAIYPKSKIEIKGMMTNPTRVGFVKALIKMGVRVNQVDLSDSDYMEQTADFEFVGPDALKPLMLSEEEIPGLIDEIPILAVAAMYADGESQFHGLAELRVKESDRLEATKDLVNAAGGNASISGTTLLIKGTAGCTTQFEFDPLHDHRLAMAAAVLAKKQNNNSVILNPGCVDVSFPGFFDLLDSIS